MVHYRFYTFFTLREPLFFTISVEVFVKLSKDKLIPINGTLVCGIEGP